MRPSLPTLGAPPKRNRLGSVVTISMILGAAAGGVWWWKQRPASSEPEAPPAAALPAAPPVVVVPTTPLVPTDPLTAAGLSRASVKIEGPLETALVQASDPSVGPALAQVVTRSLVWWVQVPNEILRGDTLDVLYQTRPGEEPLVHAVRFVSNKTGQTHRAYRFQAPGDSNPRYYLPTGDEMEMRLEHSPLDDYEQVTSLLRDGRRHKGVDFKAAVGTPVKAPFAGVVKRKNWNFGSNGNCVELEELGGKRRRALFLHLSELSRGLAPGSRFSTGQVIAASGNSGRSFAPHLHYQLMTQDDRVIDPFDSHRTFRRSLPAAQRGALEAEIRRMDSLLAPSVAGATP
ncbi:M23 family metallopeptidase [Stigmatella erecta]|uniref:Murein DD-endopeptidase MepM and murein hydrolase activator NlpD, contain LysM domain n=1 Tax=Stigmatella erecta TaxID=83460 RepID=A0A1I0AH78_9BACT|nr:M23 family metallopeptidase [Stigmatella erecta]SES93522.1 Murein DD-endopeptidase MepM and murein hydrolase activator NlpD, contain LysM domain [Stigmatella erecta]